MKSRKKISFNKTRLAILLGLVTICWLVLVYRLIDIQVAHGKEYKEKASKQSSGKIKVRAQRGLIFDRSGRQIAVNVLKNSLYAYPSNKNEISRIYHYLDRLYNRQAGESRKRFRLKTSRFKWLNRNLDDKTALKILHDSIPGLFLREEIKRDYPFGAVGRQLVGCTDIDGSGISGLEYYYDSVLAGTPGLIDYLRDAHCNTYRIKEIPLIKSTPGNSIVLTIDWEFQEIVEDELKAAVDKYNALEGTAIFLDCRTGEILAAADYSVNGKNSAVKLKAASNCFEPGSVFKIFTAATLLDKERVDLEEKIYCENGYWKCKRGRLRDDKKHDSLNFQEIFELSSNIGIGKLALRLGGEQLIKTAKRFGFGTKTFAGLPGEQSGMIGNPGVWSEYNIAALSIGHSISVTSLQLANAVSAVANSGELMRPSIIGGVINDKGKLINKSKSEFIGRVAKKKSIEILHKFMEGVVENGTATPAKSEIITIAGKTGTAEIVDAKNGGYIKNRFNSSFLGYFPAENPRIAGIVVLHQPRPITYGGHTAGPAFKNMAERYSIAHSDFLIPDTRLTSGKGKAKMKKVPDFVGREMAFAQNIADKYGFDLVVNDTVGTVVWQFPSEGRKILGVDKIAVLVSGNSNFELMCDLRGMKVRTAIAVLDHQGISYEVQGHGRVKKQYPSGGARVNKNKRCRLVCGSG